MSEWTEHERRLIRRAVLRFSMEARNAEQFHLQKGPNSNLEKAHAAASDAAILERIHARMMEAETMIPKTQSH